VLLSFIATTWLLAMLPGVGQALMLRQTLTQGPGMAVATTLGTATGLILWSVAAGAGLSAVALANPAIYRTLLICCGAVLACVGMRTLWTSSRSSAQAELAELADRRPHRRRTAYLAGLATNLANPKAGVFAISLLPAFAGTRGFLPTVSLGLVWSGVTASWYLLFVLLIARGRMFVTRPRAQRALGFVSGSVLVAVGLGVALGI
jgi:threonine/homoserine/homoserine lactone efflux protein